MTGEEFNACDYLLDRHIREGNGNRLALTGVGGDLTYADLHDRVRHTESGLRALGLQPEQRVVMFMADSPDFVTLFLAAMRLGAIPVPVSTMLRVDGLVELLRDSRARMLAVTADFTAVAAEAIVNAPELQAVLTGAGATVNTTIDVHSLDDIAATTIDETATVPTSPDSPAFWLYTSGTTGRAKAAMHRHNAVRVVCETYGAHVLGIQPDDRCLSVAKAFFAYGLGNSVLFPLSVGACAVLEPSPARPELVVERATAYGATLFFGSPTFFANMMRANLPRDALEGVRLAASAGEALPAALYQRWTQHFGVDVIDGLGMTEMLHIFLSNREGQVRPGTSGVAVPGYDLRIVDESGQDVPAGGSGTLLVRGGSTATGYWARF
jgi:benzoate-CoA ligase family protein